MPYLVYADKASAHCRSASFSAARGRKPGSGTTRWWPVVEAPDDTAVIVTDDADPPERYADLLAAQEAEQRPT